MQVFDLHQIDYDDGYANGTANGLVDAAFKKIQKNSTGFLIWRIENMNVVAVPRDQYGIFYDADSYIVYAASLYGQASGTDAVTREIRGGSPEYHIHFWLGRSTTPDKSGVAAYKTVELDAYLGGSATQHRETQGNESARFRSYFKNGFRILKGGLPSGLNEVIKSFEPKLYKIKGKRSPVVIQQDSVCWENFNSGDVLIVITPNVIFVWVGRAANGIEKLHATKTAIEFKSENNISSIVFVDDGYEQTLPDDEKKEFQKYLPLNKRHVMPVDTLNDMATEKNYRNKIKLYRCSDNSGKYRVTELKSGPLKQEDLDSDDVFVLDHGTFGIWVWVGKRASDKERSEAMRNARGFVKKKKYPNETHVTRVVDGAEPYEFKMLFLSWKDKDEVKSKTVNNNNNKAAKIAITKFDATLMHERPILAAETQLLDDGSGVTRVWRIKKSEAVEISREKFGNFFSGDCYIIWYNYQYHGQKHIIYSWFGLNATQEEIIAATSKAIEVDNELGGIAMQVRVIQNREPAQLLQIFKGKLLIFKGKGTDYDESGRNTKTPINYLLHTYGSSSYSSKAIQVSCKASSLNSNYCFVLRKGKRYYVWSGIYSTGDQREMAKHFTGNDFELILEGKETQEFWDVIGGKENYTVAKILNGNGEVKIPRLFHCSTATGVFKVTEIFNFNQSDLVPEDVMLLDANNIIFIWIGKLSTGEERKRSCETALEYLKTDPAGRDAHTSIIQIKQGSEPPNFTGYFGTWDISWWSEYVSFDEMREQIEGGTKNVKKPLINNNASDDDFDKYDKYPINILKEATEKLPTKVDPLKKELHLTHDDFVFLFKMKYHEFTILPKWKQQELKKRVGLF